MSYSNIDKTTYNNARLLSQGHLSCSFNAYSTMHFKCL